MMKINGKLFSAVICLSFLLAFATPIYAGFGEYNAFIKFWAEYVYPYPATSPDLPPPSYSSKTITLSQAQASTLQNVILKHSGGKMVVLSSKYDGTDTRCRIVVYSSTGALLSDRDIYVRDNNNNPAVMKIVELNSTHVLISFISIQTVAGPTYNYHYDLILYNINTYTETILAAVGKLDNQYFDPVGQTSAVQVGEDWYFLTLTATETGAANFLVVKYDTSAQSISHYHRNTGSATFGENSPGSSIIVQDPVTEQLVYVMSGDGDDLKTPHYFKIDLDAQTIELLATHPVANCTSNSRNFVTLGGRVDYNDDGYIYVYWAWIYPYLETGTRFAKFVQYKQQYNNSVATSELLDTEYYAGGLAPGGLGTGATNMWAMGAEEDYTNYYLWTPYRVSGVDQVMQVHVSIGDWYTFGGSTYDTNLNTVAFLINEDPFYPNYRTSTTGIGLVEQDDPHEFHFYYGMPGMLENWDIDLTHTPATGLETDTRYKFTATFTKNNEAAGARAIRYINDVQVEAVNSTSGIYEFYYTPSTAGWLDIAFKLYNFEGTNAYNETFEYLVLSRTTPTEPTEDLAFTIDMFIKWTPILLMTIVPAAILGAELGAVGYVTGLVFGVLGGIYAGIFGTGVLYITLLLVAIIAVVYMRGRGE